jgi:hypothetical protein
MRFMFINHPHLIDTLDVALLILPFTIQMPLPSTKHVLLLYTNYRSSVPFWGNCGVLQFNNFCVAIWAIGLPWFACTEIMWFDASVQGKNIGGEESALWLWSTTSTNNKKMHCQHHQQQNMWTSKSWEWEITIRWVEEPSEKNILAAHLLLVTPTTNSFWIMLEQLT